jgi:hypothetical protein
MAKSVANGLVVGIAMVNFQGCIRALDAAYYSRGDV